MRKGQKMSEETKAKIGAAHRGRKCPYLADRNRSLVHRSMLSTLQKGKSLSPEHCARISAGMTGKKRGPHSPEHRAKISAAHAGMTHTEATRAKISALKKGVPNLAIAVVNTRHGHAKAPTRTYRTWRAMVDRCTRPNVINWADYGGRGIRVCARWNQPQGKGRSNAGFEAFLSDMGERPPGKTINRINNALGYFPENCNWESPKGQAGNKRPRKSKEEKVAA